MTGAQATARGSVQRQRQEAYHGASTTSTTKNSTVSGGVSRHIIQCTNTKRLLSGHSREQPIPNSFR